METIQLLVETESTTTNYDIENVFGTDWDVILEKITSMDTFKGKKFWITLVPTRKISVLLDKIDQFDTMQIVCDTGYLGIHFKYWNVSRIQKDIV
jgi:hypothetical protein